MENRLRVVEQRLQLQLGASICDKSSVISANSDDSDDLTIRAGDPSRSGAAPMPSSSGVFQHAFEKLLYASWVYRRNVNREEDLSVRSSVLRSSAWSALSEISLANISIITVMALPIETQEVANSDWYCKDKAINFGLGHGAQSQITLEPGGPDVIVEPKHISGVSVFERDSNEPWGGYKIHKIDAPNDLYGDDAPEKFRPICRKCRMVSSFHTAFQS